MKIEKSVPWIIILAIWIMVVFSVGIVFKEISAEEETATTTLSVNNNTPSVGTVILNAGDDITLTESVTITVSATTTVTDTDGYSDISTTTGKLYHSLAGSGCSDDDNNCYSDATCVTSSCSGNSCTATCNYEVWFHATPTDVDATFWDAWIKAIDTDNASSSATTAGGVDMNTLRALDVSGPKTLYERYNTGDNTAQQAWDYWWFAQTFTVGNTGANETHNVTSVKLKLNRAGSPGTGTVAIYDVDGDGKPTSSSLCHVDYNFNSLPESPADPIWVEFSFTTHTELSTSTKYAIVISAPNGDDDNEVWWYMDSTSPTYTGGSYGFSWDSGDTWSLDTDKDFMFEEYESLSTIVYGTLSAGQDSSTLNQTTTVTDTGNEAIDIYLYGTNLASTTGGWYTGWSYRKKLTIYNTKVDDDLTDFPVLVATTADSDLASHAQSDGDDILFTSSDGTTKLNHEIEYYASSTGKLVAWVQTDLASTTDTELYIYYGNALASNQENATSVWDSNFLAVYHMDESSGTTCDDSTGNGNDGTYQGSLPTQTTGKIGYGQYFDGTGDYITLPSGTYIATTVTVSLWQQEDNNDDSHCFYSCAEKAGDDSVHKMAPYSTSNDLNYLYDKDGVHIWDNVDDNSRDTNVGFYAHMFDGSSAQLWHDSGVVSTAGVGTAGNVFVPTQFWIGTSRNNTQYYLGWMEEFRISDIKRSDNWMSTTYNTQNDPSTFMSWESKETGNFIPVENQEWSTSTSVSYGSGTDATSSSDYAVELDLSRPTSHPSTSTDDTYWGIGIPSGQAMGTYSGTTTYEAKAD